MSSTNSSTMRCGIVSPPGRLAQEESTIAPPPHAGSDSGLFIDSGSDDASVSARSRRSSSGSRRGTRPRWPTEMVSAPRAPGSDEAAPRPAGRIGRHQVYEMLGRGGMGVVFKAYDPSLERFVAIKLLHLAEQGDTGRFAREARVAARLEHPAIVRVLEVGRHRGAPYLVMDFIDGESLEHHLGERRLAPRAAADLVRKVALALQHAHERGVVHRDVKPQNVLIDRAGEPRLTDFGLAMNRATLHELTGQGEVLGTPAYMAPEQARGQREAQGPATDVWALGALLYRILAGRSPFAADRAVLVIRRVLEDEPTRLRAIDRSIHPDLETIALRCLEKDPRRRYASADEVACELRRFLDGEAIAASPPGRLDRAVRYVSRNPTRVASLALAAGIALAATAWGARAHHERSRRDAAVASVLDRAQRGALGAEALHEEALFVLLRQSDRRTAVALGEQLDRLSARLRRCAAREPLVPAVAAHVGLARSEAAAEADVEVDALIAPITAPPGRSLDPAAEVRHAAEQARLRIAAEQAEALGDGGRQLARLCCAALARIGQPEVAVGPLSRYLFSDADPMRAVEAADALCRIGGDEAVLRVLAAAPFHGVPGPFWNRVAPLIDATDVSDARIGARADVIRGLLRLSHGRPEEAIALFSRAIAHASGYAAAWDGRAVARMQTGDLDGALADFERALALAPGRAMTYNNRGQALLGTLDHAQAEADFSRAIELDPWLATAWSNRGALRMQTGDHAGAATDVHRAIELAPGSPVALINRGIVRLRESKPREALEDFTLAIELDPRSATAWASRGQARLATRDLTGALEDLNEAIRLDASNWLIYMSRGLVNRELGRYAAAIEDFTLAAGLTERGAPYYERALVRRETLDVEGTIADCTEALAREPDHVEARLVRASGCGIAGRHEAALEDVARVLALDPDRVVAWRVRAEAISRLGRHADALGAVARCLELGEADPINWFASGRIHARAGDLETALARFDRCLRLAPGLAEGWLERGLVHQRLGDTARARRDLRRAVEVDTAATDAGERARAALLELGGA